MACFALELEMEVAQLEAASFGPEPLGCGPDPWWKDAGGAFQGDATARDQADQTPAPPKAAPGNAGAPAAQQQPAAAEPHPAPLPACLVPTPGLPPLQTPPQQQQQQQEQQEAPEQPQAQPQAQPACAGAEPAKVVHLRRQPAVRTHGAFLRRTLALKQLRCSMASPPPPALATPAPACAAAEAAPAAPCGKVPQQPPSPGCEAPAAAAGGAGALPAATRSSSAASEHASVMILDNQIAEGPLARLLSCDSDQDAFHSASGPSKPAPPQHARAPAAAAAPPGPWCPPALCYWDVADSADDLALGGARRFVRHDQEDVVDVAASAPARSAARGGAPPAAGRRQRGARAGGARGAEGAGAGAAARGAPGELGWDGPTAGSATGTPTAAMIADMQPCEFGVPQPAHTHGGSLLAPGWQPRRHPLAAPPLHAAPPPPQPQPQPQQHDEGACAVLAGVFPSRHAGARAATPEQQPEPAPAPAAAAPPAEQHEPGAALARRSARPNAGMRLDAAAAAAAADAPAADAGADAMATDGDSSDGGARPKKRPASRLLTRPQGCGCVVCGATSTPVWRTGPQGPKTLCNRCGVRYSKMSRRK